MTSSSDSGRSLGVTSVTPAPGYDERQRPRMGFFTDTTVCIGCKACEVACKEWNGIPTGGMELSGNSYDNTGALGANTWRHVAFVEQRLPQADLSGVGAYGFGQDSTGIDVTRTDANGLAATVDSGVTAAPDQQIAGTDGLRWLMSSDVCKHCTTAACLDVCPTGALFKTEFATVVVQPDVCNGCGYCVPACPYGVLDRRPDDGRVWKCTLCYDRLKDDLEPACAKACPTDSINFGTHEAMLAMAADRLDQVIAAGSPGAQLYGDGPSNGVDGAGSVFLLLDAPEVYGLPPDPIAPSKHLRSMWGAAFAAAGALIAGLAVATLGGRR